MSSSLGREEDLAIFVQNAQSLSPYSVNLPKGKYDASKFWENIQQLEGILKKAFRHFGITNKLRILSRGKKSGGYMAKMILNTIKGIKSNPKVNIPNSLLTLLEPLVSNYDAMISEVKGEKTKFKKTLLSLLDMMDIDSRYSLVSKVLLPTLGDIIREDIGLEIQAYTLANNLVYLSYAKPTKFLEFFPQILKELRSSSRDSLYNVMVSLNKRLIEEFSRRGLSKENFYMEYLKHLGNGDKPLILSLKEYFIQSNPKIIIEYLRGKITDVGFNTRNISEKTNGEAITVAMSNNVELGVLITMYIALKRFLLEYFRRSEIRIYEDIFLYLVNKLSKGFIPRVELRHPLQYINQENPSISSGFKILPKTLLYVLSLSREAMKQYSREIRRRGEIKILTFFQEIYYRYSVLLKKGKNRQYFLCLKEEEISPRRGMDIVICYDVTYFLRGLSRTYSKKSRIGAFSKFALSLGTHLPNISQYVDGLKRFLRTLEEIIDSMIVFDIKKYRILLSDEKTKGIFGEMEEFLNVWGDYFYERYILDVWK